jgi:DNA polymerase-1
MSKIVFDVETNGLLEDVSEVWCICTKDIQSGQTLIGVEDKYLHLFSLVELVPIKVSLKILSEASILIGHNIVGFDLHIIERFFNLNLFKKKIRDTLCMSKLFNPERVSHSLESYGVQFNRPKRVHEEWSEISPDMLIRCSEDVEINTLVYDWMVKEYCKDWDWVKSINLEQEFLYWQVMQEMEGVTIDVDLAKRLIEKLDKEVNDIDSILLQRLPKRCVKVGATIDKPFKKDGTLIKRVTDWMSG